MKNKMNKKKKIVLNLILIIILVATGIFIFNLAKKNQIIKVDDPNYSFEYDNTWKIEKKEESEIDFLHKKSKSELKIRINEIDNDMQYKSLDEIFDSFLYNIQNQNSSYKLIYKEKANITKQNLNGYKLLFEANDIQTAIYLYRQNGKLVIFTYEATNDYFDILLDSVNNIIYNFTLNEEKFDIKTSIDIQDKEYEFSTQDNVKDLLNGTQEFEIASSNYSVKYELPANFIISMYNSMYGYYEFKGLPEDSSIKIYTDIYKKNIFEYLDENNNLNIYEDPEYNSYSRENEAIKKYSDDPVSYMYANKAQNSSKHYERIAFVYELNRNHVFVVNVCSKGIGIPKELVDMIKVKEYKNIANAINSKKENGYLIGELKHYIDYKKEQTESIILKLPEDYTEVDKQNNLFEERCYESEHYKKKPLPKYEVKYSVTSLPIDKELDLLKTNLTDTGAKPGALKKEGKVKSNDKEFSVYSREYTQKSTQSDNTGNRFKYHTKEKVLFYSLQDDKYLVIIIRANDCSLKNDLVDKFTDFSINVN